MLSIYLSPARDSAAYNPKCQSAGLRAPAQALTPSKFK